MEPLKFTSSKSAKIVAWQKQTRMFKKKALKKQLSSGEEEDLLEKIRKGNEDAVIKLVESSEAMIYSVMGQCPSERFTVEELFEVGKARLINLAHEELNSVTQEHYFRFAAWHVKQAITEKENQ